MAEKAVRELEDELTCHEPHGGPVTPLTLSIVTARRNSRLCSQGLSTRELWVQRDQFSNVQIPLSEDRIIETQHRLCRANHPYSQMSKAPLGVQPTLISVDIGDLVYLHADRNTSQARQCYLVTSVESDWCNIRKFIGSQLRSTTYRIKRSECY